MPLALAVLAVTGRSHLVVVTWYLQLMALSHISNLVMRKKSRQARRISGIQRTACGIVDNLWITYKFFDFI